MPSNFSQIWAQLASPFQASGMIPFVDTDNVTITGDVVNFSYDPVGLKLDVTNGMAVTMGAVQDSGTANTSAGTVGISTGNASATIMNALAEAGDLVFVQVSNCNVADELITYKAIVQAGSITITLSAANTSNAYTMSWLLVKAK